MNTRKIRNQDGLTLLEVLVAIVIMSVSLLLLLNMAMIALDSNDWSNNTTVATQLMQEKLENLRSEPNLQPYVSSGTDTVGDIRRAWLVTPAGNHLRRVEVMVQWADLKGQATNNSITAFIKTDSL